MKKFITICLVIVVCVILGDILFYKFGVFIDFNPQKQPDSFVKVEGKKILLRKNNEYSEFEIRGVDLGAGIPGHFATDYAIDKETYFRWFKMIQEMGANTIRVYTILHDDFYDAVYEYNVNNENPLYVIHGLWVNDYVLYSHHDAYDKEFIGNLLNDSKILVDVLHGNRRISLNEEYGNGNYKHDISNWVLGYIIGVEWESVTVAYTDNEEKEKNQYIGKYMYTTDEATPFEAMLAEVGDKLIEYESTKYKKQRLVAFSNWPTTDPIDYSENIAEFFNKCSKVDVEHIKLTDKVISGTFASYHIYPYFPDYMNFYENKNEFIDDKGNINTYRRYLEVLNQHHTIPVIISEYGVPSSRGLARQDKNTCRNQGGISEQQQGEAILECYSDIKESGCSGSILFMWQDEWSKKTWNTIHAVNLEKIPYWSDYQTNEQCFGLLSFDPGVEKSVCYVDGDISEWNEDDAVSHNDDIRVSMKYDEKFVYFMVNKKGLKETDKIYIPIDTTQKTGSNYCNNNQMKFERNADFVICIDGKENSRIIVQDRYDTIRAMFCYETEAKDAYVDKPDKNSDNFNSIRLLLQTTTALEQNKENVLVDTYETGKLTYGNANPESENFNSLADFCINGDYIEIKLPWLLLNFSNPSEMMIHDDYYEKYGVEEIQIDRMYVGIGTEENKEQRIKMEAFELQGWGQNVTYHERLKESYYIIKEAWNK